MDPILLNSPLFKGLNSLELNGLFNRIAYQVRHFSRGEMLAQSGENVNRAMLLIEGKIWVFCTGRENRLIY